ncbi:MAG TPA: maleylacetoacetate isomerase [Gammaproteobacteria bacterium]
MELYTYFRSSAAYRVRIALNIKQLEAEHRFVHLVRDGGEQHHHGFHKLNPQERVPVFVDGGKPIAQSMAIIEYLEEIHPNPPLLPGDTADRAWVRSLANLVACDIHPLNNLAVIQYLQREFDIDDAAKTKWFHHWMNEGFKALEAILAKDPRVKTYCYGNKVSMADLFVVPQVYNAKRFDLDMSAYPTISRINEACLQLDVFKRAAPENQRDAE